MVKVSDTRHRLRRTALALLSLLPLKAGAIPELPALAVPDKGAYTGAYIDFGVSEDEVTLEKIEDFGSLVGKKPAIVAFANSWAHGSFPTRQARIVHNAGAVPLILWYPWVDSDHREDPRFSLERILEGELDGYIEAWAREARTLRKPVLVSFGLEMNGEWYPWSGKFHGAGTPIPGSEPPRFAGPETFRNAFRHVVERARSTGAANLLWVFHVNNVMFPWEEWNHMVHYYPGSDYVDWIGMSAYGKQFPGEDWFTFEDTIVECFDELAAVDPTKPVMLAEWGVGEFPQQGEKAAFIQEAFARMPRLPRLKAEVFWHERWQNSDLSYSNLRASSSLESLEAFRRGIADPFWIGEPVLRKLR